MDILPSSDQHFDDEEYESCKKPFDQVNDDITIFSTLSNFFNAIFQNIPHKNKKPFSLDCTDGVFIVILTALAVGTRLFRIQFPKQVIFDEVYFGNFTNWYLQGLYFQDIHPPLAKLILAFFAQKAGYDTEINFENLKKENSEYPTMIYVSLRMIPAFFGSLCVPLIYLTGRLICTSRFAALCAALMTISDPMLITESRFISSDSILHFFSCLSIFSVFLFEFCPNILSFIFECLSIGCAISCKYTAGGILLFACLRQMNFSTRKLFFNSIANCALLFGLCSCTFLAFFVFHISELPFYPEAGMVFATPEIINRTLTSPMDPKLGQTRPRSSLIFQAISLFFQMHKDNMGVPKGHPFASPWWSWPLCLDKWVLLYRTENRIISCMGNVLSWYPIFFGTIINITRLLFAFDFQNELSGLLLGYLFSLLPFVFVPRDTYIYHYAISLFFGILQLVLLVEQYLSPKLRGFFYSLFSFLAIFGFFFWSVFVYGFKTNDPNFYIWSSKWPNELQANF